MRLPKEQQLGPAQRPKQGQTGPRPYLFVVLGPLVFVRDSDHNGAAKEQRQGLGKGQKVQGYTWP